MKISIRTIVLLSFILALSCTVFFSFYAYRNLQFNLQENRDDVQTHNMLNSMGHLFDDMQNLETGYRGYLITGKENFLDPYYAGMHEYDRDLRQLKTSSITDTQELSYINAIATLANHKAMIGEGIIAAFNKSHSSANENNLVEEGKIIMDSIRIFNSRIERKEKIKQSQLNRMEAKTNRRTFSIFLSCTAVLSLLLATSYLLIENSGSARKKAEDALKENEEKYRKLFERNPLPMMICETGTNQFLDVNDAALEQYRYTRDEFLSLGIADIQPGENKEVLFDKYKYVVAANKNTSLAKHKRKDGSFLDAQINYCDISFHGDKARLVLANDITVLMKTDEENKRLATVLENTSDFVTLADLEQSIIFANKAARKTLQYEDGEELSQKKFLDYLPPDNKNYFTDNIFPVAFVQGMWRGEGIWMNKEQQKIPVSQVILVEKPSNGTTGFIASIARDISEAKNRESEIQQMNEQLRALAARLQNIREEERSNIAREIHDDLGQQLTAIKIDVSWIAKKTQDDEEVNKKIDSIISMLNDTVKSIRRISTQLRPSILDDLGLIEALEWQTEEFEKRYGIAVNFVHSKDRLILDPTIATGLFRIFQEALTNIARHANATFVEVNLRTTGREIVLSIRDNGKGFETDSLKPQKTLGLFGMKERALMMGGHFEINNTPGQGVMISVNAPLNNQD